MEKADSVCSDDEDEDEVSSLVLNDSAIRFVFPYFPSLGIQVSFAFLLLLIQS